MLRISISTYKGDQADKKTTTFRILASKSSTMCTESTKTNLFVLLYVTYLFGFWSVNCMFLIFYFPELFPTKKAQVDWVNFLLDRVTEILIL